MPEIERLARQSTGVKPHVTEFFMNERSPGIVAATTLNGHYASHEPYLDAIARQVLEPVAAAEDVRLVEEFACDVALGHQRATGAAGKSCAPSPPLG